MQMPVGLVGNSRNITNKSTGNITAGSSRRTIIAAAIRRLFNKCEDKNRTRNSTGIYLTYKVLREIRHKVIITDVFGLEPDRIRRFIAPA